MASRYTYLITIFVIASAVLGATSCARDTQFKGTRSQGSRLPDPEPVELAEADQGITDLRARAEQGNAEAQLGLGGMYFSGRGVPEDAAEGVRWWRLAAEQGHLPAQTGLGGRYYNGRGVVRDEAEAIRWYRLAAEQGDAEVLAWLLMTAEQGSAEAQVNLAEMYADGRGVMPDVA